MNDPAAGSSGTDFAPRVNLNFEFRGNGGEYFRIWIVNLLLTVVTLGIYSAWAKVRTMRYFYGNTILDGHGFEYHAKPLQILKGRLIVFGIFVLYSVLTGAWPLSALLFLPVFLFGIPWVIMKARLFQMRMTSYRNLRFNFHGTYGGAMGAFIGHYFLTVITFGIMFPVWVYKRVAYTLSNVAYGKSQFKFVTQSSEFWGFCYATAFMAALTYGAFFALIMSIVPNSRHVDPDSIFGLLGGGALLGILLLAAAGMGIWGYYQARFTNASFGGIEVGSARVESRLKAWPLAWIEITNLIGMVFTLGLFYPWAAVRKARYQLENMSVETVGGLAEFQAAPGEAGEALGEEFGEFMDVDFGI